jgi:bifunctional DNA-binding transcriptional regulator/antitoxin component of YhaV-PrlF toxin-antitoxin module
MHCTTALKIYSNGRVTVQDYIRQALGLGDGDMIKVIVERTDEETKK